jgi:AraC-like DNA-binding protein
VKQSSAPEPSVAAPAPALSCLKQDTSHAVHQLQELGAQCGYKSRELARELGITQRHLQRLFAARMGCSPRQWLKQQRLLAAGQMLRSTRAIKEVALTLGFASPSQLSRDFRAQFGVVPSKLREEYRRSSVAALGAPEPAR